MMEVRAMAKLWTDEPRQTGVTCFVSLTMSEKGQLRQIQEALVSGDIEALKKVLSSQEFKCSGERIARVLQIQMENQPIAVS